MIACTSVAIFGTTDLQLPCLKSAAAEHLGCISVSLRRPFCVHPSPTTIKRGRNATQSRKNSLLATFTCSLRAFTFGGDAGGRLGGGWRVSVGRGFSAPGSGFGDQRGGEGVDVRGVGDVAQLVLCLGIIKKRSSCYIKLGNA